MLFKKVHLQGIKSGNITLAFRRWKKASIKSGSLLHTSIGLVKIGEIETVNENDISEKDVLNAGFTNRKQLLKSFARNRTGTIFKISVNYHSEDPRMKLREQTELTEQELTILKESVQRLDKFSKQGSWTSKVLLAIKDNPNHPAIGITKLTGFEKEWLKRNIRKLKNLGLTISHNTGYEISPLGRFFIEKVLDKE
ncbi:MAG: hypothetical protein CML04_01620 [Pseudozobellia sp.]|nr:hypothetical protein [Pseudozobellia sp.]MBG48882.1 hypothetical protein [Pseudozobellia sp.]|tara:strand:+ start:10377 stop:10964 length:588 start_codon:yes stop_codon:yes gene_type:complete